MIDNRVTLAVFFGLGGVLLQAVALSGAWNSVDRPLTAVLGLMALMVGAALKVARRLPVFTSHVLVLAGTAVIAAAVWACGGGLPSAAVAMFSSWVVIYGALFLPRRHAVAHSVAALGTTSLVLRLEQPPASAALHITLLVVITASTGIIVGLLTRRARVLASTDALTGLLNEQGLAQLVTRDLATSAPEHPGMLVLLDLDRFGELNQALGRDGGDELLRQVAQAFQASAQGYGWVARLGGDDFAVWVPHVPEPMHSEGAASSDGASTLHRERLVSYLARDARGPFEVDGIAVELDVTAGVVLSAQRGVKLKTLLQRADTALHAARRTDRAALVWSEELEEHTAESVQLQAQLRAAVPAGQLRLHYQPLIGAHSRQVHGVEALVRWQHPTRGLLAPAAFVPEAERTSVIVALTDWVLGQALEQAAAWARCEQPLRVSVNLSARLLAHESLAEQVRAHLERTGVPAHLLMLEVTESAVTTQPRRAAAALAELRALGVRIALDDFGTGYTSLAMLQDLPFDELKVDRRFVAGAVASAAGGGGGDEAIVRTVVDLAHRLGFEVVGEGVEDEATARLLAEAGYDLLQGYHFSRPVPAEELQRLNFHAPPAPTLTLAPAVDRARAHAAEQHATTAGMDGPALRELSAIAAHIAGTPVAAVTSSAS